MDTSQVALALHSFWTSSEYHQVATNDESLSVTRIFAASCCGFQSSTSSPFISTEDRRLLGEMRCWALLPCFRICPSWLPYGRWVSAQTCLALPPESWVSLGAACFPCSHQASPAWGWLPPWWRPVLVLGVFKFIGAQFYSGTLRCSNEMMSRFSSFSFCFPSIPIKFVLPFYTDVLKPYTHGMLGIDFSFF